MLHAILVSLGAFTFAGGTIDDAVAAFHKQLATPVAAIAADESVRRLDFEYSDAEEAKEKFGRGVRLVCDKELPAFGPAALPFPFRRAALGMVDPYASTFPSDPKLRVEVKDAKVSLETHSKGYLPAAELALGRFSKPFKVHWLVGKCRLAVRAKDQPEEEFLRMVAFAAVATFQDQKESYALELDVRRYRKMRIDAALAMAQEAGDRRTHSLREELLWRIEAEAFRAAKDEDLTRMMAKEGSNQEILLKPAPVSTLGILARQYVREAVKPDRAGKPSPLATFAMEYADLTKPLWVSMMQCGVCVTYPGRKPKTRISL